MTNKTIAICSLLIAAVLVAPSILVATTQPTQPPPLPEEELDEVPQLTVGSLPELAESLIQSAPGMAAQAPQVCINVVVPLIQALPGLLPTCTTEMLAGLIPDLIRVLLGTLSMWPALTPFHVAWLAELPSIVLAFINALPTIYATCSIVSVLSLLLRLILLSCPPHCIPYYSAIFSALAAEVPSLLMELTVGCLGLKILWSYIGCFSLPMLEVAALPAFLSAFLSCTLGMITALPGILSAWISTIPPFISCVVSLQWI